MNRLLCLVKKELIEYPFILRFPIVIACVVLLALALFMSGNDVSVTWQVNGSSIILMWVTFWVLPVFWGILMCG
ncbi:hypothetical protein AS132_13300 [Photobacterium sanguinicancri]|nr:hypothetical protein AS132_13300 [Photobacterium sanguinicancri]